MVFQSENELEKVAISFLKDNHLLYSWQVPLHNRIIDLAALTPDGNVIGIEFKLRDWKRALKQAVKNSNAFDYIYICVPGGSYLDKLKESAFSLGVGVLTYCDEISTIKEELPAQRIQLQWEPNVEYIKKYLKSRGMN